MPDVSNLFQMQILLLVLMGAGVISAKAKILNEESRNSLSDLIIAVFLPCSILNSFFGTDSSRLPSLAILLVVSAGLLALGFFIGKLFFRKCGVEQKKVLLYGTIISNANFLGNPIVESIFGVDALIYTAVYLIPIRVAIWTLGIAIFTGSSGSMKKVVFHPCLIATYLGFIVMFSGFKAPAMLSRIITTLGNCTTPLSMIVVGSILGLVQAKKLVTGLALYYSSIRLLFIPLLTMGIMLIFNPEPVVIGVAVILSGTPAPVTTAILASKYNSDSELAGKMVFMSTLLSVVTLPALIWLLQLVV